MHWILAAVICLCTSSVLSLVMPRRGWLSSLAGVAGPVAALILGAGPSIQAFTGAGVKPLHLPWQMPFGSLYLGLDALSAVFLLPVLLLTPLAAIYGVEYLHPEREKRWLGPSWFFFNTLAASMVVVCISKNGLLFLVAWEVMAITWVSPIWGLGILGSLLALIGVAPFSIFMSEFLILKAAVDTGAYVLLVLFLLGAGIVFAGALGHVIPLVWGPSDPSMETRRAGLNEVALVLLPILALLVLGLWMPDFLRTALTAASQILLPRSLSGGATQ